MAGSIDKLYSLLQKGNAAIEKAQSAVLDAADILEEISIESTAIGGKIAQIVPSNLNVEIAKLTNIADKELGDIKEGSQQSSLKNITTVVENTPYRDIKPQSASEIRQSKTRINLTPDTSGGAKSQISEEIKLEDFFKKGKELRETREKEYHGFSFDQLREMEVVEGVGIGEQLDEEVMEFARKPVSFGKFVKGQTQKIRETIENDELQDDTNETEELNESLDISKIRSPGLDSNIGFNAIFNSDDFTTGHVVE